MLDRQLQQNQLDWQAALVSDIQGRVKSAEFNDLNKFIFIYILVNLQHKYTYPNHILTFTFLCSFLFCFDSQVDWLANNIEWGTMNPILRSRKDTKRYLTWVCLFVIFICRLLTNIRYLSYFFHPLMSSFTISVYICPRTYRHTVLLSPSVLQIRAGFHDWLENESSELKQLNSSQCAQRKCQIMFNTSSLRLTGAISGVGQVIRTPNGTEVAVFTFNSIYLGPETEVPFLSTDTEL